VDRGIRVVAVTRDQGGLGGFIAGPHRAKQCAIAIVVVVHIPPLPFDRVIIDLAIAVVVDAITHLGSTGVDVLVRIITVAIRRGETIPVQIHDGLGRLPGLHRRITGLCAWDTSLRARGVVEAHLVQQPVLGRLGGHRPAAAHQGRK
jgi:hypothetical protein